ncbi:MAG: M1 family aminopeptidase [Polyangiales bacterium]
MSRNARVLAACLVLGGAAVALAQNAPTRAPAGPFYDTAALLPTLRSSARGDAATAAGVGSLDALPRYDLTVRLDDAGRAFTVDEVFSFTNPERAPMREVVLRVYANATRPAGHAQGGRTTVIPPMRFVRGSCEMAGCTVASESPSVLVLRLASPLAPGGRLRARIAYEGTLDEIAASRTNVLAQGMESLAAMGAGEGSGDYGLLATGSGIVSLANFYPVLARRDGVTFEREDRGSVGDLGSDDLAHVTAVIDTPAGYRVATTGVTTGTANANGRQRVEVAAGMVRDFAALMGRTLETATRRVGDVEVRSHFLPAHRAAGERVLDVAAHALETFDRDFGAYPYTELDVVEAPLVGGAGGVEFPGLVTVAMMFYEDPARATQGGGGGGLLGGLLGGGSGGGLGGLGGLLGALGGGGDGGLGGVDQALAQTLPAMLEFVTAHEVAHQWWHGLVGSDSRRHPFVDESLAQWSAAYYLERRYGAERARRDSDMQVKMNYQFMRLLGNADAPVDQPASAFASPIAYAGVVYGKGPYFYNAAREALGDAAFLNALRRYVSTWRFRTAPPDGFAQAAARESPSHAARVRALARRWFHETHGDDDLGQADLASLLGTMTGGDVSPELRDAMRALGPLLGGRAGPARATGGANGGTPGAPSQEELQRVLQQALEGLGGL